MSVTRPIPVRKALVGVAVGACAGGLILALAAIASWTAGQGGANPFRTLELKTYDWRLVRTATPETARQDIALVEIDEYSLRNLEPNVGRWPWPRAIHSMLIDFLARGPARVIGYDVGFPEADTRSGFDFGGETWSGRDSDAALVESVKNAGNVLVLTDAIYEGAAVTDRAPLADVGIRETGAGVLKRDLIFPPFAGLAEVAGPNIVHSLFVLDPDGPIRHTIPLVRMGERVLPSLGLAAAMRAQSIDPSQIHIAGNTLQIADRRLPLEWRTERTADGSFSYQWGLVNFRGPALLPDLVRRPYPKYSAFDLLNAENQLLNGQKPEIDPAVFKNKIVFVGVSATGLKDVFETPFAGGAMPGIQVHAAVTDDILSNRFMTPAHSWVRIAAVLGLSVLVGTFATLVPAWWASAFAVAASLVFITLVTTFFARGLWLNMSQPVLGLSVALFGGVGYQYFVEGREKRKMKRLFGQYVSKDIYEQLVANPELAKLGGQRREMTVLFSDIRGFTTVTERGQPEEIVGMLNEYFSKMVEVVFQHNGTLDKFVGDMVMALFGAPLDDPDHAEHAVQAALAMTDELAKLNARWAAEGRLHDLDIGIGVNTGPMIAGNIGSEAIMSYTVIGDAVNLGSRLESLNKQYGTRIIISDATKARLTGRYHLRPLGDVVVKGKTQPVAIFEVAGRAERAGNGAPLHDVTH